MIGTTPQSDNLDLSEIATLRSTAHATIHAFATSIIGLADAVGDVDAALRMSIAERSIDEQQGLVAAARRLSALLTVEGTR